MPEVTFNLNGRRATATYDHGTHLLEVLRMTCGVVSPKNGCSQGFCGSCTVLVDGRPALACQKDPADVEGREVTTLEGLPESQRRLLARAFVEEDALQCGFCTPGIAIRTVSLLRRGKAGDRDAVKRALNAHLCRCTGYTRIHRAIARLAESWEDGELPSGSSSPAGTGVGAAAKRYRGEALTLGEKPFVADMKVPGMLHAAVVLAPHPRCRVAAVDTTEAAALPGVVRILTAADIPGHRFTGPIVRDTPVMVATGEITRCVGDVLAVVVAERQGLARRAAAAVRVEAEPLDPVTSPEAALAPGAPAVHAGGNLLETCAYARGDVDAALAASAHVVRRRFATQRIEHAFLEPEACLAVPREDPGVADADSGGRPSTLDIEASTPPQAPSDPALRVYSQGQGVHEDQAQIASVLGLARELVEVELVSTGGAFGGKEDLSIQAHAALAAHLLGRPVRLVLTREQSILIHPKRHPLSMEYEAGCDADGRLTAVRARIVGDTGAYASVGTKVLERAAGHACGPYRVDAVDVEAKTVYTNNPPCGAMRGFGANQAAFAIEGVLDLLADATGLDRWEIRHRNALRPGDRFATGQIMTESCGIVATLDAVRDIFRSHPGAGIACGIKNTGIGNGLADTGRVVLTVGAGGAVELTTGFTEMGQGLFTILGQVVSEETGIPAGAVTVRTVSRPETECGMTTASRATVLAGEAARRAARALAADLEHATLAALAGRSYRGEYVCDFTVAPGTPVDNPVTHLTFGYATQVVVLDDAGRLARVVAAHDVGRAINPAHCRAQIEGAIHMGLGYALSEDLPCTDGRPDSLLLRDLGILKASAMPEVEVILLEVPDAVGPYGAKGVGEIGLVPTAAAVAGALASFDGIRRTSLPMSDAAAARSSLPPSRRSPQKVSR